MSKFGLSRKHTKRTSRDLLDFDYINKLTPDERAWLSKFSGEYYQSTFDRQTPLHSTKEIKRKVYSADNERRRDMWVNHLRMPFDYLDTTSFSDAGDDDE